jgi:tetratricopeptide (TPR) repeat protein
MSEGRETELAEVIDRGLAAVEADDLEAAEEALSEASKIAGENHVRVLHLAGMHAWAQGDVERAAGFLMQAVDLGPDSADIYLDCAECLFTNGEELDEAEASVRIALKLPEISDRLADEARLLLAQIRLADDDTEEALATLDQISGELRSHPACLSTTGAALLAAGRFQDAIEQLQRAVEQEPEDPDFVYQLAVTRQAGGDEAGGREAMVRVLELDVAASGDGPEPPGYAEVQELRSKLEDIMEELPEGILRLVAHAPIKVQQRATEEQVRSGVDPRSPIAFLGIPQQDDADAELEGIVILRDLVLEDAEDEEEIPLALFYGMLEELRRFFRREDLAFTVSEDESPE